MDFLTNLAIAVVIGLIGYIGILVVHYINTKTEAGETINRAIPKMPEAETAYDAGQTPEEGRAVVENYYRNYGTPAQKAAR
jgi:hypothetical protein